jgi:hypothetical protein
MADEPTRPEHPLKALLKSVTAVLYRNVPAGMALKAILLLKMPLNEVTAVLYLNTSSGMAVSFEQPENRKVILTVRVQYLKVSA